VPTDSSYLDGWPAPSAPATRPTCVRTFFTKIKVRRDLRQHAYGKSDEDADATKAIDDAKASYQQLALLAAFDLSCRV
jgi:hypothetical protein